ncbi:hypothetical protein BMI86_05455 [Thioclava sp. DLFJ5-1]|nr:hypothetical protein BMI86_05455 [Thioclava sp. DLFJ5-1]
MERLPLSSGGIAVCQARAALGDEREATVAAPSIQGEPIPDAVQVLLFQPFSRPGKQGSLQDLGLGLYIAAEIARAHGGELTVESTASAGTTSTLRMPSQAQ